MARIPQNLGPFQLEPHWTAEEMRRRQQRVNHPNGNVAPVQEIDRRNRELQDRLEGKFIVIFFS